MLLHILFYFLFRNTSLRPVDASPITNVIADITSIQPLSVSLLSVDISSNGTTVNCSCNHRSLMDIIWGCASTLFLCTWLSVHMNTPTPNEESWKILWRRLKTVYWALIAPELVTAWAIRQYWGARMILKKYRLSDHGWTMKHAQFLQMGGFQLRDGNKITVLYPSQFYDLYKKGSIKLPNISTADIDDKSKMDSLSKIILVFQTLWFVVQCIARHIQGMALAQLEVTTLGVISCTFMLSLIWWHKPFDARQPIILNKTADSDGEIEMGTALQACPRSECYKYIEVSQASTKSNITIASKQRDTMIKHGHLFTVLSKPCQTVLSIFNTARNSLAEAFQKDDYIPRTLTRIMVEWTVLDPIKNMGSDNDEKPDRTRVGTYFAADGDEKHGDLILIATIGILTLPIGLIPCIVWNSDFPSTVERTLWRISSIMTAAIPSFEAVNYFFGMVCTKYTGTADTNGGQHAAKRCIVFIVMILSVISYTFYVVARVFLFLEAFLSFRALHPSELENVEWTNFIPHI
ncbi:hypothetical protein BDQ17DRAFT_1237582 [Cyathus striatus]|nr:hypothetical protein BDQ17DRAFT_1237582 [Cyathus striatus]